MSFFCVHFTGVFLLILDLCQAAFRNNKDADTVGFSNWRWESQTKIKNDTIFFFLSRRCWKHSLWEPSAMMRYTAITPPWERWNLIRSERLQKHIFILISLVKAAQGSSVGGPLLDPASPVYRRLLAFHESLLLDARGWGHLSREVFAVLMKWAQEAQSFWWGGGGCAHPVGVICNTENIWESHSCQNQCVVKQRKEKKKLKWNFRPGPSACTVCLHLIGLVRRKADSF